MAGSQVDPWERRDGESAPAFQAFKTYRDMGITRSNAKVSQELGKAKTLMDRWSSRHQWVIRAAAWDREDDRKFLAEQRNARKTIARRHQRIASSVQSKVIQRLNQLDPSELTPAELIRWLEISSKMEATSAEVDLDTKAYREAQAQAGDPMAKYQNLTDEERRERMAALRRELDQRTQIGQEEIDKGDAVREKETTFLEDFEEQRTPGGSYAIDHRGESA